MSYPALTMLFGGYLNEDVFFIYQDVDSAIVEFVADNANLARLVGTEIVDLVSRSSDAELSAKTMELGLAIDGGYANEREWLGDIAGRVRAALATRPPGT